ncbi:hypothetical protein L917_18734 [Phytophthora nicotianae]|uniref:Uncharacterized protein n=3 Tax=Phytophthora nicotianae TaxID=4792 RepID=V9FE58_PHYNI|nr:hypothetical protein F443_07005 [Phytophthora nicotianae P1569]ETK74123.1 hypothetical protein L915_19010 [Phytophthora nicotianae]ETO59058.1 hypothetical protein F444_22563 [Phytophthora nicotianae P1976]ETL27556.1 hypothetical protein L916_18904 [Phytophthora nicotianae]ETL80798.1 hypothetical protein L917_18734 [Phytophthora nicotianae]
MLSIPLEPNERVPLTLRDNLEIIHVRRTTHSGLQDYRSRQWAPVVFKDPVLEDNSSNNPCAITSSVSTSVDLEFIDSDDEGKAEGLPTEQADIALDRHQNRALGKRNREATVVGSEVRLDNIEIPTVEMRTNAYASSSCFALSDYTASSSRRRATITTG